MFWTRQFERVLLLFGFVWPPWLSKDVHRNIYLPSSIDLLTVETSELSRQLSSGSISSLQLVKEYYRRVQVDNKQGLCLHAILSLTPKHITIATAKTRDKERRMGKARSALHGIPIFIKGNMATGPDLNMSTSFGAYAFQNATSDHDAFLVAKAREAGMIIMGKTNLGELNGFKDPNISPGWSKLGDETISPYDGKHPCGSSGGSAVAVAAGFSPVALGSETQGSISCPASFTAVYALKPSTGLLSRSGILPSSTTFDAPGMFGKSAWDLASLLTIVAGLDSEDPFNEALPHVSKDYTKNLASDWSDWRLGVADRDWFWSLYSDQEDDPEQLKMFDNGISTVVCMSELGANVTENIHIPSASQSEAPAPALMGRIIRHEMKLGLDQTFSSLRHTSVKSLEDLVSFNHRHPELAFSKENPGQSYLEWALKEKYSEKQYKSDLEQAYIWGVEQGINYALDKYDLDALIVPGWSEMSIYAAWAGAPTATVPLGMYDNGKPYGLGFVARRFEDEKLLRIMALYESMISPRRLVPQKMIPLLSPAVINLPFLCSIVGLALSTVGLALALAHHRFGIAIAPFNFNPKARLVTAELKSLGDIRGDTG